VSIYEGWVAGECGYSIIPFSFYSCFVGLMVVFPTLFYTLLPFHPLVYSLFPPFFLHTISLFLYKTTYTGLCLCVLILFFFFFLFLLLCVSCCFAVYWLQKVAALLCCICCCCVLEEDGEAIFVYVSYSYHSPAMCFFYFFVCLLGMFDALLRVCMCACGFEYTVAHVEWICFLA
jgi:hypothetical protein